MPVREPRQNKAGEYDCDSCDYIGKRIFYNPRTSAQHCESCVLEEDPLLILDADPSALMNRA